LVPMEIVDDLGSTSKVYRVREGLVWKSQRKAPDEFWSEKIANAFKVEHKLLQRLGNHPGIVRYVPLLTTM
jgi:serine/threonine protein kinase